MRYFYLGFILTVATIIGLLGFRGGMSRKPPLEIFPDMVRQAKLRPQTPSDFYKDNWSSRPHPDGTVARTKPYMIAGEQLKLDGKAVYPYQETPLSTGRINGTTNFTELSPVPVSAKLIDRGQERYNIYCQPCHSPTGNGQGVTGKFGVGGIADLHSRRIVEMTDGQIFYTITHGSPTGLMGPYGPMISVEDRWAIVSYVRALERSQLATMADVPEADRAALNK
ncbi:MAG: cytochrome [Verrucomicrobiales bacterium]|nr:cytochrome [Verrucomicrobiales bacterium]